MHLFCHDHPRTLTLETSVVDARPGRVRLQQTPFYPGGGGQLPDRGAIRWQGGDIGVVGFEYADGALWHLLAEPVEMQGTVEAVVNPTFRQMMRELHTGTHILNAFVFQDFDGALVTGVQMNDDGTARMDFDVPEADNDRLRALEEPINDMIRQNRPVRCAYVPYEEAKQVHGLIRSRSVAPPPTEDGRIRIVEIDGLDRQACGGTHLDATGEMRDVKILKIENKGRHNRRIRIGLVG
ncbi:MAG TPA: alanyl-tRNA editing protein [Ferrovibrio sp.]|uniref:alanyl-tRNA editing protein n=1 Tax=Ferrovibrio sp. TaxID=1917215 RepID=UPI002ED1A6D8